ncbi:MAG: hypothetical protein JNL70_19290 [Saprospiraceae bacterium]|nr:hypothetical protein [Saprospiraceae bacterium]
MKKLFKIIGIILLIIIVLLGVAFFTFNEKLPVGIKGEKAEILAQKMLQAVNKSAWDSTPIISWTSRAGNTLIWDKSRNLAQVEWKNNKVLLNIANISGKAWTNQTEVTDPKQAQDLIQKAYKFFINDAFWLNPVVKIFDDGVERSTVTLPDGREGLMVSYKSGGVTPGDSYVWLIDETGLPIAWKIWVKILPIGGLEFSWDDWMTLPTGAKVSTAHKVKGTNSVIPIMNIKTVSHFETDPFLPIL